MVNATFSGPRRAFYLFDARKIRVAIDVSMADLGRRTFNISEQNIRYPKELTSARKSIPPRLDSP